jgi:hypothetical protein
MKRLQESRSMSYYLSELIFTEAALGAHPTTSALAASCSILVNGWFALSQKEQESRHDVTRAGAVVRVKMQTLDLLVRKFAGLVLVESNQDRESVFFRRFFPAAPSAVAKKRLAKQVDFVRSAIVPEIDRLEEGHPLKGSRDALLNAAEEALEAIEARKLAKFTRASIARDIEEWKLEVNAFRMTAFGDLMRIAANEGYPRSWAEGFFRMDSTYAEAAEDEAAMSGDNELEVEDSADKAQEAEISVAA